MINSTSKKTGFESLEHEALINLIIATQRILLRRQKVCANFNITAQQYQVLKILNNVYPNGCSRSELIEQLIEGAPDVTRLIVKLASRGFVEKTVSLDDARLSITRITPEGLDFFDAMHIPMTEFDNHLFKYISKEECLALSRICEKIYNEEK